METRSSAVGAPTSEKLAAAAENTVLPVLMAISISHLLNDTIQSLIPAIYPLVKDTFKLSFTQVGLITLTFQLTASLLQPLVGLYTDRRPMPYSLAIGMTLTLFGLVLLSIAWSFPILLISVALVGMGSSVFHPEASRLAYMASGGRRGFAQSFFQVGGNAGSSFGPLLAAVVLKENGQHRILWFSALALLAITILAKIGGWYKANIHRIKGKGRQKHGEAHSALPTKTVVLSVLILAILIF
jgi:FSR family fosmidomycin resistance protein-like MFS transporter